MKASPMAIFMISIVSNHPSHNTPSFPSLPILSILVQNAPVSPRGRFPIRLLLPAWETGWVRTLRRYRSAVWEEDPDAVADRHVVVTG